MCAHASPRSSLQRDRRCRTRPGQRANVRERLQRIAVPRVLEDALRSDERSLEPLGIGQREAVLEELAIGGEPVGEPLERLRRRPRLASLDLTDVLLREPPGGELLLAQPSDRRSDRTRSPIVSTPRSSGLSQSGCPTPEWSHAWRTSSRAGAASELVERDRARGGDVQRLGLARQRDRRLVTVCCNGLG